jgi:ABC-type phosphonate transport system ATPase subunit
LKDVVHLPPIFNARDISQSYGATPLFRSIAFTIEEGDRIGVIGEQVGQIDPATDSLQRD